LFQLLLFLYIEFGFLTIFLFSFIFITHDYISFLIGN
jgi:hypothetical protein